MGDVRSELQEIFTPFKTEIGHIPLPDKFTFPFYYEPYPLCIIAANELQAFIKEQTHWQHNFGFDPNNKVAEGGKMFGVLVVQNQSGEIGYLRAFSGKLNDTPWPKNFVPSINNLPEGDNFFNRGMREINVLGDEIRALETSVEMTAAQSEYENTKQQCAAEIESFRAFMRQRKMQRQRLRTALENKISADGFALLKDSLVKESYHYQHELKLLVARCEAEINAKKDVFYAFKNQLKKQVEKRAAHSATLQKKLFNSYQFLNSAGEKKSLESIFNERSIIQPPAGAGDCAAPKLLHFAFKNNMKPIAMAEFWWGVSPTTTIRKHGHFYPACKNKCEPILAHMLGGMDLDPNPMLMDNAQTKKLKIVYEDEYMLAVNKPEGLLSVPGKEIKDSVATRMKAKYTEATGPLVVHRLDMATSGLLLIAKSLEVHKNLQAQFTNRTIKKRYVALLESEIEQDSGIIKLPLRVDLDNRPSQLVCFEHGKLAVTRYEVIEKANGKTRINLFPHTGRTHQLRMHMAHPLGLNAAIVGDALYGKKAERMFLHAEYLQFEHPVTGHKMRLTAKADF